MEGGTNQLFAAALQLTGGWKVVESKLAGEPMCLEIWLDFAPGTQFPDPESGKLCPVYDTKEQTWRHLNFWQYETLLHARVPRVQTPDGKVRQVEVPWARPESGFTLLFEAFVMLLCQEMPVVKVAQMLGEQDTRIWRIVRHYVEEAQRNRDWSTVRRIQVDETSSRRGHRYVTTIIDADTHDLLLMIEGKGSEGFGVFARELVEHGGQCSNIEVICMDMSRSFIAGAQKYFPDAFIVFDHFHIMQMAGRALEEVRKTLRRAGSGLAGGLWALRGNEWTRSEEQILMRRQLCRTYPKLGRAMMLREILQDILAGDDQSSLRWWCKRAKLSRLLAFHKLACSIQEHWDGIVSFMETRLTNAAIEAVNGLLQLAKRIARGFRSFRYFKTISYMKAANLSFPLPSL